MSSASLWLWSFVCLYLGVYCNFLWLRVVTAQRHHKQFITVFSFERVSRRWKNDHLESCVRQNPVPPWIKEGKPGCCALELKASFLALKGRHKRALMTTSYKPVYGNGFCSQIEESQKCFTGEWRLLWGKKKKGLKKSYLQNQEWGQMKRDEYE